MNKSRKLLNKFLYLFPTRLPFGLTEFNEWSQSIIETYDFPDNDSFRWSIATIVQSLDHARANVSKYYISLRVRKGAANQLAGQIMYDLKQKQAAEKAAFEAATAAMEAEQREQDSKGTDA